VEPLSISAEICALHRNAYRFCQWPILGALWGYANWSLFILSRLSLIRRSNSGVSMRIRALLIACLVAASSLLIAAPAQAAPATVYIYKVYFDSPGSDRGSNSSLNAEYVVIRNGDNVSHSISGRMSRRSAATHGDTGTLELMADRAPMNAQLGTDLGRVRPWVYKSAARLTSTAPP
jgi:hypothetical protein